MPNGNKLKAIAMGKCPKCEKGDIFQFKWWQLGHFSKMNKTCPTCQVNFEVEPGFFYGSMYMSYGFSVMIMIIGGVAIYNIFNDPPVLYYIIPITLVSLLFTPFNFRISRVIYLHLVSGIKFKKIAK
ncbi:MAG: DUF983 domain-containing protein [Bacteroidota bacterium]